MSYISEIRTKLITTLSPEIQAKFVDIYQDYLDKVKPLIAACEGLRGEFPGQMLNEIRACFDHMSRCFLENHSDDERKSELNKCKGHITRCVLDGYKIMLLYYHKETENFYSTYSDIPIVLVNNGKFIPELTELVEDARQKAKDAKIAESNAFPDKEKAYPAYQNAILAYDKVHEYIKANASGLASVVQFTEKKSSENEKRENHKNWKFAIISAILGAIFGYLLNWII